MEWQESPPIVVAEWLAVQILTLPEGPEYSAARLLFTHILAASTQAEPDRELVLDLALRRHNATARGRRAVTPVGEWIAAQICRKRELHAK